MIIMPVCGFLWLVSRTMLPIRAGLGVTAGLFALAALIAGITRRSHAPLLTCMASVGCLAYQLRDLTALPVKFKLIIWGSAALLLAMMLDRYLRTPRRGMTSHGEGEGSGALDLLQLGGAAALSPQRRPARPSLQGRRRHL